MQGRRPLTYRQISQSDQKGNTLTLWEMVAGYIGFAAGFLSVASFVGAIYELVKLAALRKLDPDFMKFGPRNFNDRVLLPFSGSVLGALLGSVVPMYLIKDAPPIYIRATALSTVLFCFAFPFWLWLNQGRALADRWFDIHYESRPEEVASFVDDIGQAIEIQRRVDRALRWFRVALLMVTAAFAVMILSARALSSAYAQTVSLWAGALYGMPALMNVALLLGLDRKVFLARIRRLKLYEAAAVKRTEEMEEAARREDEEARKREAQQLAATQRPRKLSLLGSFGRFLTEISESRG